LEEITIEDMIMKTFHRKMLPKYLNKSSHNLPFSKQNPKETPLSTSHTPTQLTTASLPTKVIFSNMLTAQDLSSESQAPALQEQPSESTWRNSAQTPNKT